MSRSGYIDGGDMEHWDMIRWRGVVASAARGERGQTMLRELLVALDAMAVKELASEVVVGTDDCCCTIGALLLHREVPYLDKIQGETDEYELRDWNEAIADDLDVSTCLVQEIAYENDWKWDETPAERWTRMRAWVAKQIKDEVPA